MSNTLTEDILRAEGMMVQGEHEAALELLSRLAEDAEEYIDRNCPTSQDEQWFSFPSLFERLAYRRVESDPRELHDCGEPFDRLYAALALAQVQTGDYDAAIEALKQACRWNPMDCGYRLDLAELFRICGNMQEYLALSFSVFERASDPRHLARAFLNFAGYFEAQQKPRTAAAALRAARNLDTRDSTLIAMLDQVKGSEQDPDLVTDAEAEELLAQEGLPDGANAEIAVCLLMCATDAATAQDRNLATELTLRARNLVGEDASMALLELIRASDEGGE